MDKSKPIFPNYVSKKQPTGVLWDNKFRCMPPHCCTEAALRNSRFFPAQANLLPRQEVEPIDEEGKGGQPVVTGILQGVHRAGACLTIVTCGLCCGTQERTTLFTDPLRATRFQPTT